MALFAATPAWADALDATDVLDAAARLPADATAANARSLTAGLEGVAAQIDADAAQVALSAEAPRLVLHQHHDGPLLALRWYSPGEVSTIHHHAWTAIVELAGSTSFERWTQPGPDASAVLRSARLVVAGDAIAIGERELHRQATGPDGSLELVLIGHYTPDRPTVDVEPSPEGALAAELIRRFVGAFHAADADAVAALCRDDVLVDANVPHWRFQVHGPEALADTLRTSEFAPGYRLTEWRGTPTADGAVIELECRMTIQGEGCLAREAHLLRCDADGRIARHTIFCTGIWNAATIERQGRDAAMVER